MLVIFTERKNMMMKNGRQFSTGNHPVEALLPMLHLNEAGFEFEICTPTGSPVVFETWAMPKKDRAVMDLYERLHTHFEAPRSLKELAPDLDEEAGSYAAIFVPGGHGAMLGIPEDPNVAQALHWADRHGLFTITLCHGPGSLLSTTLNDQPFLYEGYEMAVFPDSVDKKTPSIGYLPGHMPWELSNQLASLGAKIVNTKGDDTCCIDRRLITGASPAASQKLGELAAATLLSAFSSWSNRA